MLDRCDYKKVQVKTEQNIVFQLSLTQNVLNYNIQLPRELSMVETVRSRTNLVVEASLQLAEKSAIWGRWLEHNCTTWEISFTGLVLAKTSDDINLKKCVKCT